MKKEIAIVALAALASHTATAATVVEKKAMKQVESTLSEQVASTASACGNEALELEVKWDAYGEMITENQGKLESNKYKSQWVYGHVGDRNSAALEAMANICNSDEDYKEVIAELTQVVIEPQQDFDNAESEFSVDGSTLLITSGHQMSRQASDFERPIKSLF
ncbi:hypothetical protein MLC59_12315 [Marinobacter bryozoorum]|uniref:hypothetical protein n=1 Tax=Marinobacter bryozoorum TaxID=256324 RepID=UPI002005EA53|nr:hypothetical protein [Marinobacter bryozoorum]MCK7544946.1 hypothetical protein [Marinobacter bryozoorum]